LFILLQHVVFANQKNKTKQKKTHNLLLKFFLLPLVGLASLYLAISLLLRIVEIILIQFVVSILAY